MAATLSRRIGSILDVLWYAGSATETLMVLLALLAVTMGVAALFPQQPLGLQGAAAERWLASSTGSYPGAGQLLRQVGVFNLWQSWWLWLLLAALAFNIALRLAIQATALAQLLRGRRNASTTVESATRNTCPGPQVLGPQSTIPATVGPLLAYTGALILLIGLFLNSIAGWRATEIALAPGSSTALGRADAPWLSLEELTGGESDPIARIGLARTQNETPSSAGQVAAGRPVYWANMWIALRSAGPALQAAARDSRGRPLLLQSLEPGSEGGLSQGEVGEEVHLLFRQTQPEQEFALPSANLTFRVVSYSSLPEQGINVPVFLVEVYKGDESAPALSEFVVENATLALSGLTLDLQRDRYAIVEAAYLPGLIPMLLGGLAILGGVIVSLWCHPHSKAGVRDGDAGSEPDTEPAHAP